MSRLHPTLEAFNSIRENLMCPLDEGAIYGRMNYEGEIEVYCLSCSWVQVLGADAMERIARGTV